MWEEWKKDTLNSGCNAEQLWLDVCMGIDEYAMPHFGTFLNEYLKASKMLSPCLEDCEWASHFCDKGYAQGLAAWWAKG
ncbi:uncharacterized protein FTOL_11692 [Fusarium torulosum]|uniref:Uncharacterized protein n=1 Tax=Fusarium torulosum TaxID=33205 RepID=A0AAE8MIX1_9HYPO|nr:uncharacterized protein FTOL_11692 [Fusarium torulosum]